MSRFCRFACGSLALLAALTVIPARAAGGGDGGAGGWGGRLAARLLGDLASGPGRTVEFQDFHTEGLGTLTARTITVADARGIWLRIDHPVLDWHPGAVLDGRIDIESLTARRVEVLRRPAAAGGKGGGGLPPVPVRLGRLAAPLVLERPVLGQPVTLAVAGAADLGGHGGGLTFGLSAADGSRLDLAGKVTADGLTLDWQVDLPDLSHWQRLAGVPMAGPVQAGGTVAGPFKALDVAGHVTAAGQGRLGEFGWDGAAAALHAVLAADGWAATLGAAVDAPRQVGGDSLGPRATLSASGVLDPRSGDFSLGLARLEAAGAWANASGMVAGHGHRATLVVAAGSPAVERLRALTGGSARGAVAVHMVAAGDLLAGRLALTGTIRGAGLGLGGGVADRLAGPAPRLRLTGSWRKDRLFASALAIDGADARLVASGWLWPRLGLWVAGRVPALGGVASALAGQVRLAGRLVGSPADPAVWGAADGTVAVGRLPPLRGRLGFDLGHLAGRPAGLLTADMRLGAHPLRAAARLDVGATVRIAGLEVRAGTARLGGDLDVAQGRAGGLLTVDLPRLAEWNDLLGGRVAAGSLAGRVVLDPGRGQSARITGTLAGLAASGATARSVRLQADLAGIDTGLRATAVASARDVRRGGLAFAQAQARIAGGGRDWRFAAEGGGPADLAAAGRVQLPGSVVGVAMVDRLSLAYGGRRMGLAAPARIEWGPNRLRLAPVRLAVDGGTVEAEGRRTGDRLAGRIRLDHVSPDLVDLVRPGLGARGRISGTATLGGTLRAPEAGFLLEGERLAIRGKAAMAWGPVAAHLRGTWRGGRLDVSASAAGRRLKAVADGSVPLAVGPGPLLPPDAPVTGRLRLEGDAGVLAVGLAAGGSTLSGALRAEVAVDGTVARPSLSGEATLDQGRYENAQAGTMVTGLSLRVDLNGQSVRLVGEGDDGGDGRIRLDGAGQFDMAGGTTGYRAAVVLDKFHLLRREDVDATVSGTLGLAGQGMDSALTGQVTVAEADVNIARLSGGGGPVDLKVIEIHRPAWEVARQAGKAPAPAGPLTVALGLEVAVDRISVRGHGLDSQWQGRLHVQGTVTHPELTGKLHVVRGQYDLLGRPFKFQPDSAITFMGGEPIDPALAIDAIAQAPDITATATISGTARQPKVDFTSDPPLPKDEILSQLLFNTGVGSLSAFQQLQLAQMAASGLGAGLGGGGFDPLGKIRGALGLDVLQVGSPSQPQTASGTATTSTAPTLSMGKYVGRDTFVRVDQGIQGLGQVTVEEEVGHGFSVSTSLGGEMGSGLGINWRMDY